MDIVTYILAKNNSGGGGTTVVANPTLAGTEADLTGLQVGDTKYKVPSDVGSLPSGGSENQFLVKNSDIDFDVKWVSLSTWQGGNY